MNDGIFDQLESSQQLVIAMLRVSTEDSSARIGAWDIRDIAAHLAATERDCYVPRIRAIAAGENPTFDFFTNDDSDFSGIHLDDALDEWTATRLMLIGFVKTLEPDQRSGLTGRHERYGDVTVDRYLEIALEHDRDHLRGLENLAGRLTR
ncbi:MAG TPA: DinB family protein [Candidatus Dormibacteraeota bacterium]|nr:DinB family protein [Candidatus Dormibacteraeota bacterium]